MDGINKLLACFQYIASMGEPSRSESDGEERIKSLTNLEAECNT